MVSLKLFDARQITSSETEVLRQMYRQLQSRLSVNHVSIVNICDAGLAGDDRGVKTLFFASSTSWGTDYLRGLKISPSLRSHCGISC